MCFYTVTDYRCGDWRWGNMRERCPRQHRLGEVCGAKLVHPETSNKVDKSCRICENIEVKRRRLLKAKERVDWKKRNGDFQNSIARVEEDISELMDEIAVLESSRESAKSVKLASSSATYAAAGIRSNSMRLVSNGRAWEPSYDCRSPTAEMMSRLPARW